MTVLKKGIKKTLGSEPESLIRSARVVLARYGRDYAIGAVHGLAVRNMMSVSLPESTQNFYPLVKVHEMALLELEEVFYSYIQRSGAEDDREKLILKLVEKKVWE